MFAKWSSSESLVIRLESVEFDVVIEMNLRDLGKPRVDDFNDDEESQVIERELGFRERKWDWDRERILWRENEACQWSSRQSEWMTEIAFFGPSLML